MKFTHTMPTIVIGGGGGGGGRTYGFDLELIKSPSPSSCSTGSSSSLPTSTISESSSPPLALSTKRARTPRKRPNQSYTEAAALLSTICPNLFSTNKLSKHSKPFSSHLPPPPPFLEHGFLIQYPSPHHDSSSSSLSRFKLKPPTPAHNSRPCSPDTPPNYDCDYDYDVESILDEEVVGEEIDSIMGNLCVVNSDTNITSYINPHFGSLLGLGIGGGRGGGRLELGFGLGLGGGRNNIHQALRGAHSAEWWRPTTCVPVQEILPGFNSSAPSPDKKTKKKKKKKKKDENKEINNDEPTVPCLATTKAASAEIIATTTTSTSSTTTSTAPLEAELKPRLGLKLNHDDVLKAWSDHEYPFSNEAGATESSADIIARLAEIDLFPDNEGGGVREARVQRYKEKRRTRLFSKKIRYEVRKVNADRRPRMKGRFVKRPDLLQETLEEESQ